MWAVIWYAYRHSNLRHTPFRPALAAGGFFLGFGGGLCSENTFLSPLWKILFARSILKNPQKSPKKIQKMHGYKICGYKKL